MTKKDLSIYIHIPFCYSKCYYCDFNSSTDKNPYVSKYIEYLKKEINLYEQTLKQYNLKTIFFGGGTPSYIDGKYIKEILEHIYSKMDSSKLIEVTVESNPKTLDLDKLNTYKESKVNRISLGVQTLDDKLLKNIGRSHSVKDFYDTYELVRQTGFENINVDIMFNLPGQTIEDLIDTLKKVIALDVPHISLYSLSLEEGTPLFYMYEDGKLELSDEDVEREMYHRAIEYLKSEGYNQYEISNFAKANYQCNHNLAYWKLKPYIGLGLSAHSNINSYRYGNVKDFDNYFDLIDNFNFPIDTSSKETIDIDMEIAEYVMLGLRLNDGIDKLEFKNRYKINIEDVFNGKLEKFKNDGLIDENELHIVLTDKGLDLCNIVFMEILPDK